MTTLAVADTYEGLCAGAEILHADFGWRATQWHQLVGSVCGALPIAYFLCAADKMPIIFARVPKILVRWMMVFILIHDLCIFLISSWHILLRARQQSACDLLVVTWKCLLLRVPTTAAISGMTGVYLLTTVDSLCQIYFLRAYQRCVAGAKANAKIAICIIFFVLLTTLTVYYDEELYTLRVYCYTSSPYASPRLGKLYMCLFVIDVTCTVGLCFFIRRLFEELKRNKHGFIVEHKVRMRSSIAAMRFLVASTLLRCVFVWPFLFGSWLVRSVVEILNLVAFFRLLGALYIIQWYGIAFAFILYYWRPFRLAQRSTPAVSASKERTVHFEQLNKQWR